MASRYLNAIAQGANTIRNQRWTIGVLTTITIISLHGWLSRDNNLTINIPPDLSSGAVVKVGQVPASTAYAFGFYIWQQVNNWPSDGARDYGQQIYDYQWYLTPACRQQLEADRSKKAESAELSGRMRTIMEIPGQGFSAARVTAQGDGAWTILADVILNETVRGVPVKTTYIRYPLRVVRFDVNRDKNPFGLALDCFGTKRPERLDVSNIAVPSPTNTGPSMLPQPAGDTSKGSAK